MTESLFLEDRIKIAIRTGESYFREFKSALAGPPGGKTPRPTKDIRSDIAKTLVAFANADGGELLVGVEDDGAITGVPHSENQIASLLQADTNNVHPETPLPAGRKSIISIDGKKVIYFYVPKGVSYVYLTADGRCLKRADRESVPVSAENIQGKRLEDASREYDRSFSWSTATLHDLDLDLVTSVAAQVAYGITPEKCLQYLDLAEFGPDGLRLRNGAVLLFAKDVARWHPRCQVRIVSYKGTEALTGTDFNVLKDATVKGNLLTLTEAAWERLQVAITQQTTLSQNARFEQTYLYPQIACREALINAIVHRNYAIEGRGIEISLFTDRMEIVSPGSLLSTVSLGDLRSLAGVHESRNPLIARVMREVGLVREMGEGIRRIYEVMQSNALAKPEMDSRDVSFKVTLFNRSMYSDEIRLWLSNFDKFSLNESQKAVLALGYGGHAFSAQDVIDRLGIINVDQVREILTPLRRLKIVERTMPQKKGWIAAKRLNIPKRGVKSYRVVANVDTLKGVDEVPETEERPTKTIELYLGNLSFSVTQSTLTSWLSEYAEVEAVSMPPGLEGKENRGFAFVTLSTNKTERELTLELDGVQFSGRPVTVQRPRRLDSNGTT